LYLVADGSPGGATVLRYAVVESRKISLFVMAHTRKRDFIAINDELLSAIVTIGLINMMIFY
jgi:hypothetical protein